MKTVGQCFGIMLLVAWASMAPAQDTPPRLSSAGEAWEQWRTSNASSSANMRQSPDEAAQVQQSQEAAMQRRATARSESDRSNASRASTAGKVNSASAQVAKVLGGGEQADTFLRWMEEQAGERGAVQSQAALRRMRQALEDAGLLDDGDRDYEPRAVPDGQPDVPSSCEGQPACQQCFGNAKARLDSTRYRLERLRAVYSATMSDTKAKLAFADGASAIHGMSALAWQKYKLEIVQKVKAFKHAYDNKYAELMPLLLEDLQVLSGCESSVMHVPDWYDRFGYIYYQFMKGFYKRADN